jgi:hypothetical protein
MLKHPLAMEGHAALDVIDPDKRLDGVAFSRMIRRGQKLVRSGNEREFGIGLFLIGAGSRG